MDCSLSTLLDFIIELGVKNMNNNKPVFGNNVTAVTIGDTIYYFENDPNKPKQRLVYQEPVPNKKQGNTHINPGPYAQDNITLPEHGQPSLPARTLQTTVKPLATSVQPTISQPYSTQPPVSKISSPTLAPVSNLPLPTRASVNSSPNLPPAIPVRQMNYVQPPASSTSYQIPFSSTTQVPESTYGRAANTPPVSFQNVPATNNNLTNENTVKAATATPSQLELTTELLRAAARDLSSQINCTPPKFTRVYLTATEVIERYREEHDPDEKQKNPNESSSKPLRPLLPREKWCRETAFERQFIDSLPPPLTMPSLELKGDRVSNKFFLIISSSLEEVSNSCDNFERAIGDLFSFCRCLVRDAKQADLNMHSLQILPAKNTENKTTTSSTIHYNDTYLNYGMKTSFQYVPYAGGLNYAMVQTPDIRHSVTAERENISVTNPVYRLRQKQVEERKKIATHLTWQYYSIHKRGNQFPAELKSVREKHTNVKSTLLAFQSITKEYITQALAQPELDNIRRSFSEALVRHNEYSKFLTDITKIVEETFKSAEVKFHKLEFDPETLEPV